MDFVSVFVFDSYHGLPCQRNSTCRAFFGAISGGSYRSFTGDAMLPSQFKRGVKEFFGSQIQEQIPREQWSALDVQGLLSPFLTL